MIPFNKRLGAFLTIQVKRVPQSLFDTQDILVYNPIRRAAPHRSQSISTTLLRQKQFLSRRWFYEHLLVNVIRSSRKYFRRYSRKWKIFMCILIDASDRNRFNRSKPPTPRGTIYMFYFVFKIYNTIYFIYIYLTRYYLIHLEYI